MRSSVWSDMDLAEWIGSMFRVIRIRIAGGALGTRGMGWRCGGGGGEGIGDGIDQAPSGVGECGIGTFAVDQSPGEIMVRDWDARREESSIGTTRSLGAMDMG